MLPDRRDTKSAEITLDELRTSEETQYAIAKALELVGEGARRVSEPFRAAHPELPWASMRGMRHYLVHEYDRIDWPTVWATITVSVPELLRQIESLLPDVPAEEADDNPL